MLGQKCIFHHHIAYQVFLIKPLSGTSGVTQAIPDTIRVNHHYRSRTTNSQAVGFGSRNASGIFVLRLVKFELLQSKKQMFPRFQISLFCVAFRNYLVSAYKNMCLVKMQVLKFLHNFLRFIALEHKWFLGFSHQDWIALIATH